MSITMKRLCAWMLTVVMLLSMMPTGVFAADLGEGQQDAYTQTQENSLETVVIPESSEETAGTTDTVDAEKPADEAGTPPADQTPAAGSEAPSDTMESYAPEKKSSEADVAHADAPAAQQEDVPAAQPEEIPEVEINREYTVDFYPDDGLTVRLVVPETQNIHVVTYGNIDLSLVIDDERYEDDEFEPVRLRSLEDNAWTFEKGSYLLTFASLSEVADTVVLRFMDDETAEWFFTPMKETEEEQAPAAPAPARAGADGDFNSFLDGLLSGAGQTEEPDINVTNSVPAIDETVPEETFETFSTEEDVNNDIDEDLILNSASENTESVENSPIYNIDVTDETVPETAPTAEAGDAQLVNTEPEQKEEPSQENVVLPTPLNGPFFYTFNNNTATLSDILAANGIILPCPMLNCWVSSVEYVSCIQEKAGDVLTDCTFTANNPFELVILYVVLADGQQFTVSLNNPAPVVTEPEAAAQPMLNASAPAEQTEEIVKEEADTDTVETVGETAEDQIKEVDETVTDKEVVEEETVIEEADIEEIEEPVELTVASTYELQTGSFSYTFKNSAPATLGEILIANGIALPANVGACWTGDMGKLAIEKNGNTIQDGLVDDYTVTPLMAFDSAVFYASCAGAQVTFTVSNPDAAPVEEETTPVEEKTEETAASDNAETKPEDTESASESTDVEQPQEPTSVQDLLTGTFTYNLNNEEATLSEIIAANGIMLPNYISACWTGAMGNIELIQNGQSFTQNGVRVDDYTVRPLANFDSAVFYIYCVGVGEIAFTVSNPEAAEVEEAPALMMRSAAPRMMMAAPPAFPAYTFDGIGSTALVGEVLAANDIILTAYDVILSDEEAVTLDEDMRLTANTYFESVEMRVIDSEETEIIVILKNPDPKAAAEDEEAEVKLVYAFNGIEDYEYVRNILSENEITADAVLDASVEVEEEGIVAISPVPDDFIITATDYFDEAVLTVVTGSEDTYTVLLSNPQPEEKKSEETVELTAEQVTVITADVSMYAEMLGIANTEAVEKAPEIEAEEEPQMMLRAASPKMMMDAPDAIEENPEAAENEKPVTYTKSGYEGYDISADTAELGEAGTYVVPVSLATPIDMTGAENAVIENVNTHLYHIVDGAPVEVENVKWDIREGVIYGFTFETDSFSPYMVTYTVDFSYTNPETGETKTFSFPGRGEYPLSEILDKLEIKYETIESASLELTETVGEKDVDEEGRDALYLTGDAETGYILHSDVAFDDTYTLNVEADGYVLEIIVLDNKSFMVTLEIGNGVTLPPDSSIVLFYYSGMQEFLPIKNDQTEYVFVLDDWKPTPDFGIKYNNVFYGNGSVIPSTILVNTSTDPNKIILKKAPTITSQTKVLDSDGTTSTQLNPILKYYQLIKWNNKYVLHEINPNGTSEPETIGQFVNENNQEPTTYNGSGDVTVEVLAVPPQNSLSISDAVHHNNVYFFENGSINGEGFKLNNEIVSDSGDVEVITTFTKESYTATPHTVEVEFYEKKDETTLYSGGIPDAVKLNGIYYFCVRVKDKTGKNLGYSIIRVTPEQLEAANQTGKFTVELGSDFTFKSFDSNGKEIDDSHSLKYDYSKHNLDWRLYKLNDNAQVPTTYNQVETNGTGSVTGFDFWKNVPSDDGTKTELKLYTAYSKIYKLQIEVEGGSSGLNALSVYEFVDHRTSGSETFEHELNESSDSVIGVDVQTSDGKTIVTYTLEDQTTDPSPIKNWTIYKDRNNNIVDDNGNTISGNETYTYFIKQNGKEVKEGYPVRINDVDYIVNYSKPRLSQDKIIGPNKIATEIIDYIVIEIANFEDAVGPHDVLGGAAEFGIVANRYEQSGHTETNYAVNELNDPNNSTLNGSGGADIPFYVGKIDDGTTIWVESNNNNLYVFMTEADKSSKIDHEMQFRIDNAPDRYHIITLPQSEINAYVNGLIADGRTLSQQLAGKTTITPETVSNGNLVLDTRTFPDNITIYVNCENITGKMATTGWEINKLPGQSIVFNVPGENVTIGRMDANIYDPDNIDNKLRTTSTSTSDFANSNGLSAAAIQWDLDIMRHITFNAYDATSLVLDTASGVFLAPKAATVDQSNGAGSILTGGTVRSASEWHFYYQGRSWSYKGTETGFEVKKLMNRKDNNGELTAPKGKEIFTFVMDELDIDTGRWKADSKTATNDGSTILFPNIEYSVADEGIHYYRIRELANGGYNNIEYDPTQYIVIKDVRVNIDDSSSPVAVTTSVITDYKVISDDGLNSSTLVEPYEVTIYDLDAAGRIQQDGTSYRTKNVTRYKIIDEYLTDNETTTNESSTEAVVFINNYIGKYCVGVTKRWNDKGNRDGVRPDTIVVELQKYDTATETWVTVKGIAPENQYQYSFDNVGNETTVMVDYALLNEANNWTHIVKGVDKYDDNGEVISYRWVEKQFWFGSVKVDATETTYDEGRKQVVYSTFTYFYDGTNVSTSGKEEDQIIYTSLPSRIDEKTNVVLDGEDGWVVYLSEITNSHEAKTTEVQATKTWEDQNNQYGLRKSITLRLLGTYTVDTRNDGGEIISKQTYDVRKLTTNDAANSVVADIDLDGTPDANGEVSEWTAKWTNLPKYYDGHEITYHVVEVEVPDGYKVETTTECHKKEDGTWEAKLKNTLTLGELDLTKQMFADGANVNSKYSNKSFYVLVSRVIGSKTWYATSNGLSEIKTTLEIKPGQTIKLKNLPIGEYEVEEVKQDGSSYSSTDTSRNVDNMTFLPDPQSHTKFTVTVGEYTAASGETPAVGSITSDELINEYKSNKFCLAVTKKWADDDDVAKLRPEYVTVTLNTVKTEGGNKTYTPVTDHQNIKLNAANNWTYLARSLDMYDNYGIEIVYEWTEAPVGNGYTTSIAPAVYEGLDPDTNLGKYVTVITNTLELTELEVTKIWKDNNNQDGKRPDTITIGLYQNNSTTAYKTAVLGTANATDANTWTYKFTGLPKKDASGTTYTYSIKEENTTTTGEGAAAVTKLNDTAYEVSYSEDGKTVTNTYTPEKTEAVVFKTWVDDNNKAGQRPANITVKLIKNNDLNNPVKKITLPFNESELASDSQPYAVKVDENIWAARVVNLPAYENGDKIVYSWVEDTTGFAEINYSMSDLATTTSVVDGKEVTTTNITNTYDEQKFCLTVTKVWDDNNNQDGLRNEDTTVKVELYKQVGDSTPVSIWVPVQVGQTQTDGSGNEIELNKANNWTAVALGVPKYENGVEVQYFWKEVSSHTGYTVSPTGNNGLIPANQNTTRVTAITNTHTPDTISIKAYKFWDENTENLSLKQDVTLTLVGCYTDDNGTHYLTDSALVNPVQVISKDAANSYVEWKDLPAKHDGHPITYTVTETGIDGFTTVYANSKTGEYWNYGTDSYATVTYNETDHSYEVAVKNTVETGALEISKDMLIDNEKVTASDLENWNRSFYVTIAYKDGKGVTWYVTKSNGVLSKTAAYLEVKPGTSLKITDLPIGDYEISEYSDNTGTPVGDIGSMTFIGAVSKTTDTASVGAYTPADGTTPASGLTTSKLINAYTTGKYCVAVTKQWLVNGHVSVPDDQTLTVKLQRKNPETGTWEDAFFNLDGSATTEKKSTVVLNKANNWSAVAIGMDQMDAQGRRYEYRWVEMKGDTAVTEPGTVLNGWVVGNSETVQQTKDGTSLIFLTKLTNSKVDIEIPVKKTVTMPEGTTYNSREKFSIVIDEGDDNEQKFSGTGAALTVEPTDKILIEKDETGRFIIKGITAPGTYKYTLTESAPEAAEKTPGMNYFGGSKTISVDVNWHDSEKKDYLVATVTGATEENPAVIENNYNIGKLTVTKKFTFNGDEPLNPNLGSLQFTVTGKDNENNEVYKKSFFLVQMTKAGGSYEYTYELTDLPLGYTYTVAEDLNGIRIDGYTIKSSSVIVTDASDASSTNTVGAASASALIDASGATFAFENEYDRDLGDLTISKTVIGGLTGDANNVYTIRISLPGADVAGKGFSYYMPANAENPQSGKVTFNEEKKATVVLKDKESIRIVGLPADASYTVVEDPVPGFKASYVNDKGTIRFGENQTPEVQVTNTKDTAKLDITKTVVSNLQSDLTDMTFAFKMVFSDALPETVSGIIRANGSERPAILNFNENRMTVTVGLKHGETLELTGVPKGITYQVTETPKDNFVTAVSGDLTENGGSATLNSNAFVTFTNTKKEGTLTVKKTVESVVNADKNTRFTFTITLTDKVGNSLSGEQVFGIGSDAITFTNGVYSVQLAHGETFTIMGIPEGYHYTVTETGADGFTQTLISNGATLGDDKTEITGIIGTNPSNAEIKNTRDSSSLSIDKTVVSPVAAEETANYSMLVKLRKGDQLLSGEYYVDICKRDGTKISTSLQPFTNGEATLTVPGGKRIVINGIPVGASYEVIEQIDNNFSVSSENEKGTIPSKGAAVSFTNTRKTGTLKVHKTLISDETLDQTREFNFEVVLTENGSAADLGFDDTNRESGIKFGGMTFKQRTNSQGLTETYAEFTLKKDESVEATNLPVGLHYVVSEEDIEGIIRTQVGEIGDIYSGPSNAEFTNTRAESGLIVSKSVFSDIADDKTQEFNFTLTLYTVADNSIPLANQHFEKAVLKRGTDITDPTEEDLDTDGNGEYQFTLKSGQILILSNLPEGAKYTVEEEANASFETSKFGEENVIRHNSANLAKFINTRKVGKLAIEKVVNSPIEADQLHKFEFTVRLYTLTKPDDDTTREYLSGVYNGISFDGESGAKVYVNGGSSETLSGLPAGVHYEVIETESDLFTLNESATKGNTGLIPAQDAAGVTIPVAHFENDRDNDRLVIDKTVVSPVAADQDREFTFTIILNRNITEKFPVEITNSVTSEAITREAESSTEIIQFTNGRAVITMKSGAKLEIKDIPIGTIYTIVEAVENDFITEVNGNTSNETSGTIVDANQTGGKVATASFTNKRRTGDLEVSKIVSSSVDADKENKQFTFKVSFDTVLTGTFGKLINGTDEGAFTLTNGNEITGIQLKHGDTLTIKDLPAGVGYTVSEAAENEEGYQTGFVTTMTGETGTIGTYKSSAVFTNTKLSGGLIVSKSVISDIEADKSVSYHFVVTLTELDPAVLGISGTGSKSYGNMEFSIKNGKAVAEFDLKHGETKYAEGLPDGTAYTVAEDSNPNMITLWTRTTGKDRDDGVSSTTSEGTITTSETNAVIFTNTRKTGNLEISKKVVSDSPADKAVGFTFTVTLLNGGSPLSGTYGGYRFDDGQVVITLHDGDVVKITDLPVGTTYTVEETTVAGFTTSPSGRVLSGTITENRTEKASFTNTRDTGSLTISKAVVSDVPADSADRIYTFTVQLSDKITGEYSGVYFSEGKATVTLKGAGSKTITGLPVGVVYTVTEAAVSDMELTASVNDHGANTTDGATASFTNTREKGDLEISKKIVSSNPADADRSFKFKVTLEGLSGEKTYSDVSFINGVGRVVITGSGSKKIIGLPAGITYSVVEEEANQDNFATTSINADGKINAGSSVEAAFTNTKAEGALIVSKKVVSQISADHLQKYPIQVTVAGVNGKFGDATFIDGTATLYLADGDYAVITGLPLGATYTVLETDSKGLEVTYSGKTGEIQKNVTLHAAVTNTAAETEVSVKKVWEDADNQDGKRPDHVDVKLLADGVLLKTVRLSAENGWRATESGLPKYSDPATEKPIVYTWKEYEVPGYSAESDYNEESAETTITNSHTPELTEATVKKVWDDDENRDGKRPASLTVTLSNGTEVTLNEKNGWEKTVDELPKYAAGKEIVYTWTEAGLPEGYTLSDSSVNGTVTTLTNSYTPETVNVSVKKKWEDSDNQDGIRPADITVELKADNVVIDTVILNPSNGWTKMWTGLAKYKLVGTDATPIVYTVDETEIPTGYNKTVSEDKDSTANYEYEIKNSHTTEVTVAEVEKVWKDNNQTDKRPASVTMLLMKNNVATDRTVILNAENNWSGKIEDLPKYENNGDTIVYSFTEQNVGNDYSMTGYEVNGTKTTITNTWMPDRFCLSVLKVWNDNNDQDGKRPASIQVQLMAGEAKAKDAEGNEVAAITLNAANSWTGMVTNLPVKDTNGITIYYHWAEIDAPTTYSAVQTLSPINNRITVITNTYNPEKTQITVTKVWNDDDNKDGIRPASVKVELLAGDVPVAEKELFAYSGWTGTFDNLPKFNKGEEIKYSVREINAPEGYTFKVTGTVATGFTITNTHEPEKTEVTVKKIWDDNNNQDGKRPATLTVKLLADYVDTGKTVTLDQANNWTGKLSGLDKFANGKEIVYTWDEGTVKDYELTKTEVVGDVTILTNTHHEEKTGIKATKVWQDDNNRDGKRAAVTFELQVNGDPVEGQERQTIAADATGEALTVRWTDLPKYKDGKEIEYTVVEVGARNNRITMNGAEYIVSVSGDRVNGFTITNSYNTVSYCVGVTKKWVDQENKWNTRPNIGGEAGILVSLQKSLDDGKTWVPYDAVEGKFQNILLNASNGWTYIARGVPMYEGGKLLQYQFVEVTPYGYTSTSRIVQDDKTVTGETINILTELTNTLPVTDVPVTKVWADNSNQDGLRPDTVTIALKADGVTVQTATISAADKSAENTWSYVFEDLPLKSKTTNQPISYTVAELKADGTEVANGAKLDENYTATYTVDSESGKTTITNTHTPVLTEVKATKVWDDSNNQDGKRIDVNFILKADGVTVNGEDGKPDIRTIAANATGDALTVKWTDLPKYKDGKEIEYTVEEAGMLAVDGKDTAKIGMKDGAEYIVSITGNRDDGFVITNTYSPKRYCLAVTKNWIDRNDKWGTRPAELKVTLKMSLDEALWTDVKTFTLSDANGWSQVATGVPMYQNGTLIKYQFVEENLTGRGYVAGKTEAKQQVTLKVDGKDVDADILFVLTNTMDPTSIKVTKKWDDDNNRDGKRPTAVEITLLANGEPVKVRDEKGDLVPLDPVLVTSKDKSANTWTYTFRSLPKVDANGKTITYTVEETPVAEYNTPDISGYTADEGFVVTNTYVPKTTEVEVTKTWVDGNNQDGKRPTAAEFASKVHLLANGVAQEMTPVVVDNGDNTYTATFANLPMYDKGVEINYSIAEDAIKGYTTEINGFTITNTHTPEVLNIKATKVWVDNNNQDGLRQDVVLTLKADGVEVKKADGTADNRTIPAGATGENLTVIWENMPKYTQGKEDPIVYTISENEMTGYTWSVVGDAVNGFTVENRHDAQAYCIAVHKTWDTASAEPSWYARPKAVYVTLMKRTEGTTDWVAVPEYRGIKLSAENKWEYLAAGLPVNEGGKKLEYQFFEDAVPGYKAAYSSQKQTRWVNGKEITIDAFWDVLNTLELTEEPVIVTKKWDDNGNAAKLRPQKITVELLANGNVVQTAEVMTGSDNTATYSFGKLPKYDANGEEITYTVREANVDKAYQASVDGMTITNTLIPTTFRTIGKVWNHGSNAENMRPASVKVTLLADGKPATYIDGSLVGTIVLNAANSWGYTVENLPVTKDGKTIKYTWDETEVLSYSQTGYADEAVAGGVKTTITNTYRKSGTSITTITDNSVNNTTNNTTNNVTNNTGTTVMRGGGGTIINNYMTHETIVEPKLPGEPLIEIEDYGTPLGINVIINHVGDCFD